MRPAHSSDGAERGRSGRRGGEADVRPGCSSAPRRSARASVAPPSPLGFARPHQRCAPAPAPSSTGRTRSQTGGASAGPASRRYRPDHSGGPRLSADLRARRLDARARLAGSSPLPRCIRRWPFVAPVNDPEMPAARGRGGRRYKGELPQLGDPSVAHELEAPTLIIDHREVFDPPAGSTRGGRLLEQSMLFSHSVVDGRCRRAQAPTDLIIL